MPNVNQTGNWDGPLGQHWVNNAERLDGMLRKFGEQIIEKLSPQPGECILDIGCGSGAVALAIGAIAGVDGSVTGFDISGPMLELARHRAKQASVVNVSFREVTPRFIPSVRRASMQR